ncbi:MAG: hypothetical protein AB1894_29135 [Chloroflexota bacterium]
MLKNDLLTGVYGRVDLFEYRRVSMLTSDPQGRLQGVAAGHVSG